MFDYPSSSFMTVFVDCLLLLLLPRFEEDGRFSYSYCGYGKEVNINYSSCETDGCCCGGCDISGYCCCASYCGYYG